MSGELALQRRRDRRRLLRYLGKGGVIVRENIGGAVGQRWTRADRAGPGFDTLACERLLERGCVRKGATYQLVAVAGVATPSFSLQPAEPGQTREAA